MEKLTFWKTNFPHIEYKALENLLYNNHTAKLEVEIFYGRILVMSPKLRSLEKLHKEIDAYERLAKFNYSLYGESDMINKNPDVNLLTDINQILIKNSDIKIRVMYGSGNGNNKVLFTAPELKQLEPIGRLFIDKPLNVKSISVADGKIHPLTHNGKLLRKRKPKYQYRITLRFSPGNRSIDIRNKLAKMLNNCEGLKISKGTKERLRRQWCWGEMHVYTNDPSYVTFIQLIAPSAVKKISPIVQIC